jgi:hypothetical protein
MHQENTDLSASGAGASFITAAEPFHTQRVGSELRASSSAKWRSHGFGDVSLFG